MNVIAPNVAARRGKEFLEMDVLAYSNQEINEVYIVEVKSHLKEEGIDQMLNTLNQFPKFFPEHQDKRIFGILAVVDARENLKKRVLKEGIYLAMIHEDLFEIAVPKGFKAKSFNWNAC